MDSASELVGVLTAVVCVLGLAVGSFLNVVIYRVPRGLSIAAPPSACPRCGEGIRPLDNIPVLSWLILRGRCRSCREPISFRYPVVESGTSAFFGLVSLGVLSGWFVPAVSSTAGLHKVAATSLVLLAFLYLAASSVALALIDVDCHRLPNAIVLPGYVVGTVLLGASAVLGGDLDALLRAALGMTFLGLGYLVLALVYPGGMGWGDVKLAGVLGLFVGYLGWGALLVGAFAAFLLGGVFGIVLIATRRANRKSGIPFGPWMLAGAWVGIFFGAAVWDGYLNLLGVA